MHQKINLICSHFTASRATKTQQNDGCLRVMLGILSLRRLETKRLDFLRRQVEIHFYHKVSGSFFTRWGFRNRGCNGRIKEFDDICWV